MWQRIRTAVILVAIVGVAMFAFESPYPFLILLIVGVGIGAREWRQFIPQQPLQSQSSQEPQTQSEQNNNKAKKQISSFANVILFSVPIASALLVYMPNTWVSLWGISLLFWLLAVRWILTFPNKVTWFDDRIAVIGLIFLLSAMTAMYSLWSQSPWWLMYVFVLVWCADSGAYFVGRKFGKRKMAPNVSPNKSVEGLMGGVLTGLIAVLLVSFFALDYNGLKLVSFILLSLITIISSVFGDLFESMLKRQAGVKDSGTILPGHGGVLDRIDSLLFATPVFAFGFWGLCYL